MKHSVTEHTLASGARGIVVDVPGSSVINLEVRFNAGFSFADRSAYELPHVLEHMLAGSSQKYPGPNAFVVEASKNGAYVNAHTSVRSNGYVYEFAPFELERILDMVEEQLVRPYLVADRLAVETSNVREELTRMLTQPGSLVTMTLLSAAMPGQWLDYETRISQLGALTVEQLKAFYDRTFTSANALFSVAGDVGVGEAIVARLERIFRQLPRGEALAWQAERGRLLAKPAVRHQPIGQVYYRVTRSLPQLSLPQRRTMMLLRTLLVGGFASRVLGKAREKGWAYSVGGVFSAELGAATAGFGGYVTTDHAKHLFGLMGEQLHDLAEHAVRPAELEDAVRLMTGNWLRTIQTPADILSWYSDDFDEWGMVRQFDEEVKAIARVTPAQVQAAAQLILQEGRFAAAFVGDLDAAQVEQYATDLGVFGKK
ncbi:MAG TPA: pitrilysin family protein [Candidatus Saccharimonadia bacterium]